MDNPGPEQPRGLLGWCLRHPKTTVAIVVLLAAALLIFLLDQKTRGKLAQRIAQMRSRGEPVTAADLIAIQTNVPDSDNRIAALMPHAIKISNYKEKHSEWLPIIGTRQIIPTGVPWQQEEREEAQAWLAAVEPELRKLHEALQLEHCCLNIAWSTPAINFLATELSYLRLAEKSLALEARYAVERGDTDTAKRVISDAFRLRCLAGRDKPLLVMIVENVAHITLLDTIERVVNRGSITGVTLEQWQQAVATLEECGDLRAVFLVERCLTLDLLVPTSLRGAGAAPAPANPSALMPVSPLVDWIPTLRALEIMKYIAFYDELLRVIDQPMEQWISELNQLAKSSLRNSFFGKSAEILLPSLSRAIVLHQRRIGQIRAMQVALAAERYRLAEGHWPPDAGAMTPKYLDQVPADPADGKSIRYAIYEEGIKTWTISDDATHQDDGGDVKRREVLKGNQRPLDYGWVILNPELRGKPMPATTQAGK